MSFQKLINSNAYNHNQKGKSFFICFSILTNFYFPFAAFSKNL